MEVEEETITVPPVEGGEHEEPVHRISDEDKERIKEEVKQVWRSSVQRLQWALRLLWAMRSRELIR